jgi:hypothetical protein
MVAGEPTSFQGQSWRELYRTAMSETDREKLPSRIQEAERELAHRSRELFGIPGDNLDERIAIDNARSKLQALSYCIKLNCK